MAQRIGVDRSWISRRIKSGQIVLAKHFEYGRYLFPRPRAAIAQMKRLRDGAVLHVSFPEEHRDG
jgi:hypothetical protein